MELNTFNVAVSTPILSVIMSCYGEPLEWIQEAIDSILSQTLKDFEFIIINDNPSRDELSVFLKQASVKDQRIKIISNQQNIGLTKSLNIGLQAAQAKYIARMDADDLSLPHRFEKQVRYMESNPECGIVGSWVEMFGSKQGIFKCKENNDDLKAIQLFQSPFDHPATVMRATVLKSHGIVYNESLKYAQDQDLWAKLSKVCEFHNIQEVLFRHRFNYQQVSKNHSEEQIHNVKMTRKQLILDFLNTHSFRKAYINEVHVNSVISFLSEADGKQLTVFQKKCVDRISMTLMMSLEEYSFKEFCRFIKSGMYLRDYWSIKEFLRSVRVFLNGKRDSYLGVISDDK